MLRLTGLLTAAIVLVSASVAFAETRIYSSSGGGSFPVEPSKLEYSQAESGAGESLVFKKLDWNGWGADKASSDAKLKACSSPAGCFTTNAKLKAKHKQKSAGASYYTKLKVSFGQQAFKIPLPLPSG